MEEMRVPIGALKNGLTVAALLAAGAAWGQSPPDAPQNCVDAKQPAANCAKVAAPPKSAAQAFPFPGEEPSPAERPADVPPDLPASPASDSSTPAAQGKQPRVPPPAYPGDPDAKSDPAASSSSSSSSSSGEAADGPPDASDDSGPLADAGSSGDSTRPGHSRRRKLPKVEAQTPESRAAEDLKVAEFYQNDGNYLGAYLRAKDAVENQPDDPNSHFALAEAAFKLGKRDEAREHYTQVLKLDPIPKQLKASQKALEELGAAPAK